jgi:hypothetical protein
MIKLIDRILNKLFNFFKPKVVSEDGKVIKNDIALVEESIFKFKTKIADIKVLNNSNTTLDEVEMPEEPSDIEINELRELITKTKKIDLKAKPFKKFSDGKSASYFDSDESTYNKLRYSFGEDRTVKDKDRFNKNGELILSEKENSPYRNENSPAIKKEFTINYDRYRKILAIMYNK